MPAKKYQSPHSAILLPAVSLTIVSAVFLIYKTHSPVSTFKHRVRTSIISPLPSNTQIPMPGLYTNPETIHIGDKYGNLLLREIKPTSSELINNKTNLTVTFQGQITITGKFDSNSCFWPNQISAEQLPRFPNTSPSYAICFTNASKLPKTLSSSITIDNLSLIRSGQTNTYTATFIKAN